jgi:hypothetical protein
MADLVGFAREIPMSIKIAWVLWMAWSVVQAAWFRRARVAAPVYQALPPRRRVPQPKAAAASPIDVPGPAARVMESEAQPAPVAVMEMPPGADELFRRG